MTIESTVSIQEPNSYERDLENISKHDGDFVVGTTQRILEENAPRAAVLLSRHIKGTRKRLPPSLQRACEYTIDHAIGKAKVKVEHSGGTMTYADLTRSVEELEKAPPKILVAIQVNLAQGCNNGTTTATVTQVPGEQSGPTKPAIEAGQETAKPTT